MPTCQPDPGKLRHSQTLYRKCAIENGIVNNNAKKTMKIKITCILLSIERIEGSKTVAQNVFTQTRKWGIPITGSSCIKTNSELR